MSAPIGPGDLVECVDAHSGEGCWMPGEELHHGAIYTVADVFTTSRGWASVELHEVKRAAYAHEFWGERVGYGLGRFRPVRRPNIEILKSLLTPAPERSLEDA